MNIALFPNEKKNQSFEIATAIRQFLESKGVMVVAEDEKAAQIGAKPLSQIDPNTIQFLITMGGDGTILRLFHRYSHLNAPILGINLGHLGFMADVQIADINASLTALLNGQYTIQKHLVIETTLGNCKLYALNDIVVHRAKNYSLIELTIKVNGSLFNTFVADGIILATPTGSTAYSLAAGGPILTPNLEAIVITPICPHTISNRPIVLSADQEIEILYSSEYDPIDVRADGLDAFTLKSGERISVKKSSLIFKRVCLPYHNYFSTLRSKLGWSGKLIQ
jgi:NAD+ kinase